MKRKVKAWAVIFGRGKIACPDGKPDQLWVIRTRPFPKHVWPIPHFRLIFDHGKIKRGWCVPVEIRYDDSKEGQADTE